MKAVELRAKSADELRVDLTELLKAQFSLRMQIASQQSNKTADLRKLRRNIACVNTILHEKTRQA